MSPIHPALWLTALGLLTACGGTSESPLSKHAEATGARRQVLAAAPAASGPTAFSADALFDWAEQQYPGLFPAGAATQAIEYGYRHYTARQYLGTANSLGLVNGGTVYGLGSFTNGEVQSLGSFEDYLCRVSPAECSPRPARLLRVRIDAGSLQCEPGSGSSRLATRRRLTDAGVTVVGSDCGFVDGVAVPAVCGYADTRYWTFDIDEAQAARAAALGFLPVDPEFYTGKPSALACSY